MDRKADALNSQGAHQTLQQVDCVGMMLHLNMPVYSEVSSMFSLAKAGKLCSIISSWSPGQHPTLLACQSDTWLSRSRHTFENAEELKHG